jgi:hypothetical protein
MGPERIFLAKTPPEDVPAKFSGRQLFVFVVEVFLR